MRVVLIINPEAAHGRAGRQIEGIRNAFGSVFSDGFEVRITTAPGHAVELAAGCSDRDVVVAVGGDGTASEVARGLVEARGGAALAILPVGTGNDLAHTLGFPRDPDACARAVARAPRTAMDCGVYTLDDGTDRYFFNNIGVGFDGLASWHGARYKHLPGPLAYVAGVIRALSTWTGPQARVETDDAVHTLPLMFATVANGRRSGGLFVLTPEASPFDGLLDTCTVRFVRLKRVLTLAPRTLNGSHVGAEEVRMGTTTRARITLSEPVHVHADGEIVAERCREVVCRVLPGAIPVLVPGRRRRGSV